MKSDNAFILTTFNKFHVSKLFRTGGFLDAEISFRVKFVNEKDGICRDLSETHTAPLGIRLASNRGQKT